MRLLFIALIAALFCRVVGATTETQQKLSFRADTSSWHSEERWNEPKNRPGTIYTKGNRSFIYCDLSGTPGQFPVFVLRALDEFEHLNPNKEVLSWKTDLEWLMGPPRFRGVWIDHQEKTTTTALSVK